MKRQAVYDRVRVMNKYVTNRILIHIAGRKFGHFAILSHVGRKSGTTYKTPIIAEPIEGGFVIALTYGKKVDWLANVMACGCCDLYWKEKDYHLTNPEFIDDVTALRAFPPLISNALQTVGIEYFLGLSILQPRL